MSVFASEVPYLSIDPVHLCAELRVSLKNNVSNTALLSCAGFSHQKSAPSAYYDVLCELQPQGEVPSPHCCSRRSHHRSLSRTRSIAPMSLDQFLLGVFDQVRQLGAKLLQPAHKVRD